jgi:hypothetical protein
MIRILGSAKDMGKNYVYRMDHDTGFAPHTEGELCFLSGCKKTTVELWARENSWVIGIGGKGTEKRSIELSFKAKAIRNLIEAFATS